MNDKQKLFKYLKSQNMMSLATYKNNPWVCSLYYAIDNAFNLYFITEPSTHHASDIASSSQVACAITDSHQKVTDKKVGVQIEGKCSQLTEEKKIKEALLLWNQSNPGFENTINWDNIQHGKIHGRSYMIKPNTIKYFNEKIYGPEGFKLFKF